jgi:hypothetical protein
VNVGLRDVLACLDDLEKFVCEPYRHSGADRPKKHPHPCTTMHNSHATLGFNSHKTWKTGTNKGNNKANIKLTRKHQFSNTLARAIEPA